MNDALTQSWPLLMTRASLLIVVTGSFAVLLLRWRAPADARWHRAVWGLVLAQGIMSFPPSLQVTLPAWWSLDGSNSTVHLPPKSGDERAQEFSPYTLFSQNTMSDVLSSNEDTLGAHQSDARQLGGQRFELNSASTTSFDSEQHVLADQSLGHRSFAKSGAGMNESHQLPAAALTISPPGAALPKTQPLRSQYPSTTFNWTVIAGMVWTAGALAVIGILTLNFVLLQRALRSSRPARPKWTREFQQLCLELGLTHSVQLEVHPVMGPFLCWTPRGHRVIVPVRLWNRLTEDERLAVLHHELCHLRRGDLWKACAARVIVALHWFNPLAWYSARRFDESAEWACDARMAAESPLRISALACALLCASESSHKVPYLALSVTGGPLFQRVRRLVSGESSGDTFMRKCLWIGLLVVFAGIGSVQLTWASPDARQETPTQSVTDIESDSEQTADEPEDSPTIRPDQESLDFPDDTQLRDIAQRIVVEDNESLRKFVALIQTPTGRIVMADRAATAAQQATSDADPVTLWQQFATKYFDQIDETTDQPKWVLKEDLRNDLTEYVQSVRTAELDIEEMAKVFREVSEKLVDRPPVSPILKRFLQHDGAPAFVYHSELRTRLHPGTEQLEEQLGELLVRTRSGSYVIRPTRRGEVEKKLAFLNRLHGPLSRFQKELAAWSADIHATNPEHETFAATLRNSEFARYIAFYQFYDESTDIDQALDGVFGNLEEATSDTAEGLKLNLDSDQYKEIKSQMDRFHLVWSYRDSLSAPIARMAERIELSDELHQRMKDFLSSELALFSVIRQMDYVPVQAAEAAREWLSQIVTQNESGMYEITVDSTEELSSRLEEFFRQFREVRRRGRIVDEFAAQVEDAELKSAMQTLIGKLLLENVVQSAAERPDVDGLAMWIENHFEETPDGLVLRDWAGEVVTEILNDSAEIEKELGSSDF
ncbi:MAG: hypothetical protein JNL58_13165 [Planctomyces sp.]|nr:hypothetical protein [Planctomyces sp.]